MADLQELSRQHVSNPPALPNFFEEVWRRVQAQSQPVPPTLAVCQS
jgi:hypothetical protein